MAPAKDDDRISKRPGQMEDDEDQGAPSLGPIQMLIQRIRSWIEQNSKLAFNLSILLMALGAILILVWLLMLIAEMRRPTLEMAFTALEQGAYIEARDYAQSVLHYAKKHEIKKKADAHFVIGMALCKEIEIASIPLVEEIPFYRHVMDALMESRDVGFPLSYQAEGYFYFGKSLFMLKEYPSAIEAFENALLHEFSEPRVIYWYLSNAYFLGPNPQYEQSLKNLDLFLSIPPFLGIDNQRAYLLRSVINLRLNHLDDAVNDFNRIPENTSFQCERELVFGQILIEKGAHAKTQVDLLLQDPQIDVSQEDLKFYLDHKQKNSEDEDADTPPDNEGRILRQNTIGSHWVIPVSYQNDEGTTFRPNLDPLSSESSDDVSKQHIIRYWQDFARKKNLDAIVHFRNAMALDTEYSDKYRLAFFLIGYCYEQLEQFEQAQEHYFTLFRTFPGTMEAIASEFRWCYLEYLYGDEELSFDTLVTAIEDLKNHPDYFNTWISVAEILKLAMKTINDNIAWQKYDNAERLLHEFSEIMSPKDLANLNANLYEHWAKTLQTQAQNASPERKKQLTGMMEEKYREAGKWHEELAGWMFTSPGYSEILWTSAEYYRLGRQFQKAIPIYRLYLERNVVYRQLLTHYHIGTMLFEMGDMQGALEELKFCIDSNSLDSIIPDARLQAGRVYMELQDYPKAIALLQKNLDGLMTPSSEIFKESYFLMGKALFLHKDYHKATIIFDEAIQLYPDSDQLPETLYNVALAMQEEIRQLETKTADDSLEHLKAETNKIVEQKRERAVNYLKRANLILNQKLNHSTLTKKELRLLRNCGLMVGSLMIDLGPKYYDEAEKYNRQLIVRFQGDPDVMQAYVQLLRVLTLQNRLEDAEKIKVQIKNLFQQFQKSGAYQKDNIYSEKDLLELFDAVQLFD